MASTKNVEELIEILNKNVAELKKAPDNGVESVWPVRKIADNLNATAKALRNMPDEKAVGPLVEALKAIDKRLEFERMWRTEIKWAGQAAVGALGKIGGSLAEKSLAEMLSFNNFEIRLTIARELAKSASDVTISELRKASLHIEENKATGELTLPVLAMNLEANPVGIRRITIKKQCVWCEHLKDPAFFDPKYPRGGCYCAKENGPTNLDSTCNAFTPNSRGS